MIELDEREIGGEGTVTLRASEDFSNFSVKISTSNMIYVHHTQDRAEAVQLFKHPFAALPGKEVNPFEPIWSESPDQ